MTATRPKNAADPLLEWADMEFRTVCGPHSHGDEFRQGTGCHEQLTLLIRDTVRGPLQKNLPQVLEAINDLAKEALDAARDAFLAARGANVFYEMRTGLEADEVVLFDAENIFNRFFDAITDVPLQLRTYPPSAQGRFVVIAQLLSRERDAEMAFGMDDDPESGARLQTLRAELASASQGVPADVMRLIRGFEISCLEALADSTSCIPGMISLHASPDELHAIALAYSAFGSTLRFPHLSDLRGELQEREQAERAWRRFEGAGRALQILGGWIRGLSLSGSERLCMVCYRHVASRSRCAEHATKTHETREARLGKRIRPHYLDRLKVLAGAPEIRRSLLRKRTTGGALTDLFRQQAHVHGVSHVALLERVVWLATHLRDLRGLLSEAQRADMGHLFLLLVEQARAFSALPSPRSGEESRARQRGQDRLNDLLSPAGFFRAWFSGYVPHLFGTPPPKRRGYDRRHPITRDSPVQFQTLERHLVMQRSWDEAEEAYTSRAMPAPNQIAALRSAGLSFAHIGDMFGVSHQTIRTALTRETTNRQRNRLI